MHDHKRTSIDLLQVLREGMAVVISMVILGLAAWTIGQTFLAARGDSIEAYNREKDIMLYVVSLFGTVTGYYLGRVPAEVNARRAESAAKVARQQLAQSQEKLGLASARAATGARASRRLTKATSELKNVSDAIEKVRTHALRTPGVGGAMSMRSGDDGTDAAGDASLIEAKRRIDALLSQLAEDDEVA